MKETRFRGINAVQEKNGEQRNERDGPCMPDHKVLAAVQQRRRPPEPA